jgi:hypothetical protein
VGVPDAGAVGDAGTEAWGDGEGEDDDGGPADPQPAASTPAAASAASRIVSFMVSPAEGTGLPGGGREQEEYRAAGGNAHDLPRRTVIARPATGPLPAVPLDSEPARA